MRHFIWVPFLVLLQCSPAWLGKEDNGLMEGCLVGMSYKYGDDDCEDPQPLIWDHVPLSITMTDEFRARYLNTAESSSLSWNGATGLELFCFECREQPDVYLGFSEFPILGRAYHGTWPGRFVAIAVMADGLSEHDALFVLVHELGHVLGLAHDESCQSIMYAQPLVDRCIWGDPGITDHDADLLRSLYEP